jgi:uncharacterized protein (DUF2147 family)
MRLAAVLLFALCTTARAQVGHADPRGLWMSDTRDGVVDMRSCGNALCAYLYAVLDPSIPANATDVHNPTPRLRNRPICGLPIMGNLQPKGPANWGNGWIYDPKVGKTYDLEVTLRDARTLVVHGYMGVSFLGRTVNWTRPAHAVQKCAGHAR